MPCLIRLRARLAPLVLLASAAVVAACGKDATGTGSSLSGTFALASIGGQGLPVSRAFGLGSQKLMLSGQLQFLSRGRLLDVRETQIYLTNTNTYEPSVTDSVALAYRIAGDTLFVVHTAFDTAAAYTDTGFVVGTDGIQLYVHGKPGDLFFGEFVYGRTP